MKTKFLVVLLILSGLLVSADKTYACNDPPNADLDASPNPVCVGCSVTLDGSGSSDPDGEITKYEWDWTNDGEYDYEETPGDGIAYHPYGTPGTYTVKLRVTDDDDATDTDTCQVTVVEVASVTSDKNSASICSDFTFTVTTNPAAHEDLVEWSAPEGDPNSQNGGATFTTKWECTGSKTVTASCCASEKSKNVTVSLPDGCSPGSQTVSLYLIETCCPGCSDPNHCGETWYPVRYSGPDIYADYSNCSWVFSAYDIWFSDSDPCPSNFTEITNGNDPDLNAMNYCGIVNGFRNFHCCANVGGTIYSHANCTEDHEDCHYNFMEQDLETTEEEWLKGRSSMSDMTIDCSDSDTTTCQAAVNARELAILLDLAQAYDNAWDYMKAQGEEPCHDAAAPCFEDIADSICAVWDCNSC